MICGVFCECIVTIGWDNNCWYGIILLARWRIPWVCSKWLKRYCLVLKCLRQIGQGSQLGDGEWTLAICCFRLLTLLYIRPHSIHTGFVSTAPLQLPGTPGTAWVPRSTNLPHTSHWAYYHALFIHAILYTLNNSIKMSAVYILLKSLAFFFNTFISHFFYIKEINKYPRYIKCMLRGSTVKWLPACYALHNTLKRPHNKAIV